MNILITGGAGFIGFHLSSALLGEGHSVTILDDLSTGKKENIEVLQSGQPDRVRFVEGSICSGDVVRSLIKSVDYVFHLAAAVGVELVVKKPIWTIETNVRGTSEILESCAIHNKPVVIASSSEVYGCSHELPFRENQALSIGDPTISRWGYACSKLLDEFLALGYHAEKGLPAVIVRFFNTVGPRQRGSYGMVVPRFIKAALTNKPISIYGDGNQTRCFGHVEDVVDALLLIMKNENSRGQIFNLGNPEEISINALAQRVISKLNSKSEISYHSYESIYGRSFEDMQRRVPDITKAKSLLNWNPKRNLDKIILDAASWAESIGPETEW